MKTPDDNLRELRIQQVRTYVTMVDVLQALTGRDFSEATQQIRCPFHDDHSPSARLYADQNKVYCFTEHRSWDVVDAVQTLRQLPLDSALSWLELTFSVPSLSQTLGTTIRTQLSARVPVAIEPLAAQVEARLKSRRHALGFEKYTRLLQALDLTVMEATTRAITPAVATERCRQVLALALSTKPAATV